VSALRILVVGGLARLDAHYREVHFPAGTGPRLERLDIDCANEDCPSLDARAQAADGLVLVLGHLSHPTAAKVRAIAKRRGIPLVTSPGSSVARVRACIGALWLEANGAPSAKRALAS
jgi:hypothetical protein